MLSWNASRQTRNRLRVSANTTAMSLRLAGFAWQTEKSRGVVVTNGIYNLCEDVEFAVQLAASHLVRKKRAEHSPEIIMPRKRQNAARIGREPEKSGQHRVIHRRVKPVIYPAKMVVPPPRRADLHPSLHERAGQHRKLSIDCTKRAISLAMRR